MACIMGMSNLALAQELYPQKESASSVPKGVVGVKMYSQVYKEFSVTRSLDVLRLMYGVTSKLSVYVSGSISNHHDDVLPVDLINHTHTGGTTNYYTQDIQRGVKYPYLFNGIDVFAKYRFLSLDQKYKHFRMAAYGEWSNVKGAHDETEPNLIDDTGGYGFGLITTWLKNRFAVSTTVGYIHPNSYSEDQPDLTGGPDLPTTIFYGDAINYSVSFGYRLSPKVYATYDQVNWNVYVEFIGKMYQEARVIQAETELEVEAVSLKRGAYLEIHPALQRIVNSNLRIEVSMGVSGLGNSYVHFRPLWTFGIQRYFYKREK